MLRLHVDNLGVPHLNDYKWVFLVDRSAMDFISKALLIYAIAEEGVET